MNQEISLVSPEHFPAVAGHQREQPGPKVPGRIHCIARVQPKSNVDHGEHSAHQRRLRRLRDFVVLVRDDANAEAEDSGAADLKAEWNWVC